MMFVMRMNPVHRGRRVKGPEPSIVMAGLVITIFALMTGSCYPVASVVAVNHRTVVQLWDGFHSDGLEIPVVSVVVVKVVVVVVASVIVSAMMVMASVVMKITPMMVSVVASVMSVAPGADGSLLVFFFRRDRIGPSRCRRRNPGTGEHEEDEEEEDE